MAVLKKEFSTPNYLKLPQLCGLKTDLIEEILFTYNKGVFNAYSYVSIMWCIEFS